MKTLGRQRGQAGRAALTKAALLLFSRKGFEDTSVEEICLAAGYSKGGFYFHFGGKDDLLLQIMDNAGLLVDAHRSGALVAELWAQAARKEAVRARLTQHHDARRRSVLQTAVTTAEDQGNATRLLDLLLLLDAGLRVQGRFPTSPGGEAQDLVDSLLAALSAPSTELARRSSRAAGAAR